MNIPKEPTQLSEHRSRIKGWEYMRTLIWGNHRWDFSKIYYENADPIKKITPYFYSDGKQMPAGKCKEIKELYPHIESLTWFPLERLYTKAIYENTYTGEKKVFDLSKPTHRENFLEKSKIRPIDFFNWVLYVMEWENITSLNDIIYNFWNLRGKFQSFINSDLTPDILKERFNTALSEMKESHSVEPITKVDPLLYYQFITHPVSTECSPANALERLLFLVKNSDFLRGDTEFKNWKPSFEKFVAKLDAIFAGQYSKNHKESTRFRRLREHEIRLYDIDENRSYIEKDNFIPDRVKKMYAFKGWELDTPAAENITTQEMEYYNTFLRSSSNRIKIMSRKIREKIKQKNTDNKMGEVIFNSPETRELKKAIDKVKSENAPKTLLEVLNKRHK